MRNLTVTSCVFVDVLLFLNAAPRAKVMQHFLVHGMQIVNDEFGQKVFS
jgi:hypothetical protein